MVGISAIRSTLLTSPLSWYPFLSILDRGSHVQGAMARKKTKKHDIGVCCFLVIYNHRDVRPAMHVKWSTGWTLSLLIRHTFQLLHRLLIMVRLACKRAVWPVSVCGCTHCCESQLYPRHSCRMIDSILLNVCTQAMKHSLKPYFEMAGGRNFINVR